MFKRMNEAVGRLSQKPKRSGSNKLRKLDRKMRKYYLFVLTTILTRRVLVANQLHKMKDPEVIDFTNSVLSHVVGNANFTVPLPAPADIQDALDEFIAARSEAANNDKEKIAIKNAKREALTNLLAALSNYVENVANDAANVAIGAVAIIESAAMRAQIFSGHIPQIWNAVRGDVSGSLELTAASSVPGAVHFWAYTTTPLDDASWVEVTPTRRAKTTITGLTVGSFVYCRHRVFGKTAYTDWEGHDPVLVA